MAKISSALQTEFKKLGQRLENLRPLLARARAKVVHAKPTVAAKRKVRSRKTAAVA